MTDESARDNSMDFASYLSIRIKNEDGTAATFRLSPTLEDADKFRQGSAEGVFHHDQPSLEGPESTDQKPSEDLSNICEEHMRKFYQSLLPFHELVMVSHYIRPMMAKVAVEGDIISLVRTKACLIKKDENIETYGLSSHISNEIIQAVSRINKMDRGLSVLPYSTLLSMVATFDSMMGDSVKNVLRVKPEKIINSDKTITYKDLFNIGDLNEAKVRFIDDEVNKLLRGSHDEQVQYIEKLIETKIREHYSRWPNFLEIFERRNIIAHSNGVINAIYMEKCRSFSYPIKEDQIGKKVKLGPKYLHKAIDILTEFGVLVWFVAWRKLAAQGEVKAYETLNAIAFEAIKSKRFDLAVWLLDFALHRQPRNGGDLTTRMMFINLANAYRKKDLNDKCQETLKEMDWSATSEIFSLALASLNDHADEAARLIPGLARNGKLTADQFREWPIFDWIREEHAVAKAFEESFGEPLVQKIEETTTLVEPSSNGISSEVSSDASTPLLSDPTMH